MAVTAEQVQALYIAYFNRPADYLGLSYQMAEADKFGLQYVADQFAKSPEYTATYAGKGTAEIINTIYLNLFGRPAEPAGIKFWGDALNNKVLSLGNIALSIYNGALNDDKIAVSNKLEAATAFYASLDTSEEIVGYSGDAANQVLKNWLSSITTDASLEAAITPAALLAVSTAATAAHDAVANVGQNFTLTTGVDAIGTFTGGAGADIFNAAPGVGGAPTLTALDNLNGGAGIDTINVIDTGLPGSTYVVSTVATVKNIEIANVTSVSNKVTADLSAWTGLTTANVISSGGQTTKVGTTGSINATDTALTNGAITATGGVNTTVTTSGGTTGGAINVTGATGNVVVAAGNVAAVAAGDVSGNTINVTGGKTVSVSQTAANADLTNKTLTQGAVNVTGDATTTTVTVNQAANVAPVLNVTAVTGVTAVAGVKEIFTATFTGATTANQTVIFDGVTYTSAGTADATATAAAFATAYNAVPGANFVAVQTGAAVQFTAKTEVAVIDKTNASFTGTATGAATVAAPTQQGVTPVTGVTAVAAVAGVGGIAQGTVTIADKNGASASDANSITSVTLNGYGANSTIASSALTTLTLANSSSGVTVTDAGTTAKTALAVTVDGLKGGASLTDNTITTVNLTASGANSTLAVLGTKLTTVTVAGDKTLNVGSIAGVTSFTSTNTGGVTATLNAASTGSFGAGADVVTIGANATKAITLGAGDDKAIVSTLGTGGSVDGGAGVDVLSLTATAAAAIADNKFAAGVTNFESLELTGVTTQAVNVTLLGAFTTVSAAGATQLTLNGTNSGNTLALTGAGTAYIVNQTNALAGTADVLNLSLTSKVDSPFGTVTATDVETIRINAVDTMTKADASVDQSITIAGNSAKSIVVTGNANLDVTAASTALTSFDASAHSGFGKGVAGTGVSFTSGALTTAATVKGSAIGGDVLDFALATKAVTITATAGVNTLTGGLSADVITGAAGADTINGGSGNDAIVGGGGDDVINGGAGGDAITISGNKVTLAYAENFEAAVPGPGLVSVGFGSGKNTATTIQTSELTSTFDVVKGFVAGDKIDLSGVSNTYVTANLTLSGTNLAAADNKVVFTRGTYSADSGTFTFATNGADTAVTYDTDTSGDVAGETIILVGFVAGADTTATAGIITFA